MGNKRRANDTRSLLVAVGACLMLFMASSVVGLGAHEKGGMPSELDARWPLNRGEGLHEEEVIVKSLKAEENHLYINSEPFVLDHRTTFVDERGRRLRPGSLWVGWLVELRYRTGQRSEARAYGPDEKILVRMRVLRRLENSSEEVW